MAGNTKKSAKGSGTKITRITASETKKAPKSEKVASTPKVAKKPTKRARGLAKPFVAMGEYFKGAWYELKQVRWPTRRATWGLTGAVVAFTAIIAAIILLLDALFKYLFELMLG